MAAGASTTPSPLPLPHALRPPSSLPPAPNSGNRGGVAVPRPELRERGPTRCRPRHRPVTVAVAQAPLPPPLPSAVSPATIAVAITVSTADSYADFTAPQRRRRRRRHRRRQATCLSYLLHWSGRRVCYATSFAGSGRRVSTLPPSLGQAGVCGETAALRTQPSAPCRLRREDLGDAAGQHVQVPARVLCAREGCAGAARQVALEVGVRGGHPRPPANRLARSGRDLDGVRGGHSCPPAHAVSLMDRRLLSFSGVPSPPT